MIGTVVGNYKIVGKLGDGGMGSVFKAVDLLLERDVAIKMLRPELSQNSELVERFRAEAVTLARLNHPNIATLFGMSRQNDSLFMIMEFVTGQTLESMIHRLGRFSVERAVHICGQALEGLEYAHRRGVVHRDIKPANLMLTEDETVKITDFGIARVLGTSRRTAVGRIIGTMEYMSPEQIRGEEVDGRTDVYSLGIVLYELLTGRVPFDPTSEYELMMAHLNRPPAAPRTFASGVPEWLDSLVMRALAKARQDRFQTAGEFRAALQDGLRLYTAAAAIPDGLRETREATPGQFVRETRIAESRESPAGAEFAGELKPTRLAEPDSTPSLRAEAAAPARVVPYGRPPGILSKLTAKHALGLVSLLFLLIAAPAAWLYFRPKPVQPVQPPAAPESTAKAPAGDENTQPRTPNPLPQRSKPAYLEVPPGEPPSPSSYATNPVTGSKGSSKPARPVATEAPAPREPAPLLRWAEHTDPAGFSVHLPQGWTARADRKSGSIEFQASEEEQVIVWPVFTPAALDSRSAPPLLLKLASRLQPDAQWERPEPAGPTAVRMRGRAGENAAVSALTWVNSPKGSAAYVYVATAPEPRYRQDSETYARILGSFRLVGNPASSPEPASLTYVRWQDPRESAFTMEVPANWPVSGGLFRFHPVDLRSAFEVTSPDGQIRITGGDAGIPTFTEPLMGFPEGSWYSPGYGLQLMVRRYTPGKAFALEYARNKFSNGASNFAVTESRDRPDAVQALNAIYSQFAGMGVSTFLMAGEVSFTFERNSEPFQGYCFANSRLTQSYGVRLWNVEYLCGFAAPPNRAGLAQTVLERIVQSVRVNPQWAAMQQNLTAETSRIVSETQREVSHIISSSYWRRQGVMDELSRRRSNATLGLEDVIDPATGRQFKVEGGSNYYWIDDRGTIVGTQTDTRPNIDFRSLVRLP